MQITETMIIGEVLDKDAGCAPIFRAAGMGCLGCPTARMETIAQACDVHGVDKDALVAKLNEYFADID